VKNGISPAAGQNPSIDFGAVRLEAGAVDFRKQLNVAFLELLKSIPASLRSEATFFLLKQAGSPPGTQPDVFRNYYPPSWSILYWILEKHRFGVPAESDIAGNICGGHARAMYLHSLDDHLNDGDLPPSHLALLIRSQAWLEMKAAFARAGRLVDNASERIAQYMDMYYAAVCRPVDCDLSLDEYCRRFVPQMATCFIAPVLLMKQAGASDDEIEGALRAYGAFGVAWRLLDDARDMEADLQQAIPSAVYLCLPREMRTYWDRCAETGGRDGGECRAAICRYITENSVTDRILQRVIHELDIASRMAEEVGLGGLAAEFRCLGIPLVKNRTSFVLTGIT